MTLNTERSKVHHTFFTGTPIKREAVSDHFFLIVGPLHFFYINEWYKYDLFLKYAKIPLVFGNDTTMFVTHQHLAEIFRCIKWLENNGKNGSMQTDFSTNAGKIKCIIFYNNKRNILRDDWELRIGEKVLWVLINETLNTRSHR